MGKECGRRRGYSNGRQLGFAERIRGEQPPEPSFSAYKVEDGERMPVLDQVTGIMLWSSVDPRFSEPV